jgi:hypothetical protein
MMERDEGLTKRVILSDEATFQLSGKVNKHTIQIWLYEKPIAVVEMKCDSPEVNVLCCFQEMCVLSILLCEEECYREGVPKNVSNLVNATTGRRRQVHFPTRRCPTTLASASHASTTKTSSAHVHLVTRPYTV